MIRLNLIERDARVRPRLGWHWAKPEPQVYRKRRSYFHGTRRPPNPNPISPRESYLLRTYGLTESQVVEMIERQGNRCPACARPFAGKGKCTTAPVVDHCHASGKVRGVPCNRCNMALGKLNDDVNSVRGLLRYLEAKS